jgi:hypothetical protein
MPYRYQFHLPFCSASTVNPPQVLVVKPVVTYVQLGLLGLGTLIATANPLGFGKADCSHLCGRLSISDDEPREPGSR